MCNLSLQIGFAKVPPKALTKDVMGQVHGPDISRPQSGGWEHTL